MMEEDNNSMVNNQIDQGPQIEIAEEKKKRKKGPIIIIAAIIILALLGYFVIYPYIKDKYIDTPQKVFENSLNYLNSKINSTLDEYDVLSTPFHELNLKISTNIPELQPYENYTYGIKTGLDQQNKKMEGKLYIQSPNNKEYSATGYLINNKTYYKLSTDDRLLKGVTIDNIDIFNTLTKITNQLNKDDIKYLSNRIINITKNNFNKDDFSKENATIKINNNQRNVVKNTYTLNKDKLKTIYNNILNTLYEDQKSSDILRKLGIEKENSNSLELEDNYELKISIYTINNTFIGIDFKTNINDNTTYCYKLNKNFEMGFTSTDGNKIIVSGVENNNKNEITIKSNEETIGTLSISKWNKEEVYIDYNLKISNTLYSNSNITSKFSNNEISGTLEIKTPNKDSNNKTIILSIKFDSNNITLTMNYKEDKTSKVADINESFAKELSETELEQVVENFITTLMDTPLKNILENNIITSLNNPEIN